MRWLVGLLLILFIAYTFIKDPEPRPIEETFIGDQVKPLQDMQTYEQEYLKEVDEAKRKMEEEIDKAAGGG